METIKEFRGNYAFLSNYYPCKIKIKNESGQEFNFMNSEAAFHSFKCLDRQKEFEVLHPNESKKLGNKVQLRDDWDLVKLGIMKMILKQKFSFNNPELAIKLLATGDKKLEEGNWWNDTYWGVCKGIGCNYLGILLMDIRKELQEKILKK